MGSIEAVKDRLHYAIKRLNDLKKLNSCDLIGADIKDRQQLIMEFFFHLSGATDFLLQIINSNKNLGLNITKVKRVNVLEKLNKKSPYDPLIKLLEGLYQDPKKLISLIPYSEEWDLCRVFNFRHHVCHRDLNPFNLSYNTATGERRISLYIDPSSTDLGVSKRSAIVEIEYFWKLISNKCQKIIERL